MNTLPAIPDTPLAGEVTGRLEMLDGELIVQLRPAQLTAPQPQPQRVRDVTTRPVHRPELGRRLYRGHDRFGGGFYGLAYHGPLTPVMRAKLGVLRARFLNPPWWSPLAWRAVHRRARADLLGNPTWRPTAPQELEPIKEGATA